MGLYDGLEEDDPDMATNDMLGIHPEVQKYLRNIQSQRTNMDSPEYSRRLAQVEDDNSQAAAQPQMLAAYGKAFSQLGTLKGRTGDASALEDAAKGLDAQRMAQDKQSNLADTRRDKQTGLTMTMMNHMNDKYMANNAALKANKDKILADSGRRREDREFRAEQSQKDRDLRREIADSRNMGDMEYKGLPEEAKSEIKDKATSMSQRSTVVGLIDAQLANMKKFMDAGNEAQAVTAGDQMLKILNSDAGKDAVGVEESKRLGSFLQNKIMNFTSPGSFFGRDLDQFYTQAASKSNAIKDTINNDKKRIQDIRAGKYNQELSKIDETAPVFGSARPRAGDAQAAPKKQWKIGESYTDKDGVLWKFNGHDFEEQ